MLVIVLPIVTMVALNIALLFVVRKQSFLVYNRLNADLCSMNSGAGAKQQHHHPHNHYQQPQHRRASGSIDKTAEGPTIQNNLFRRSIDQVHLNSF